MKTPEAAFPIVLDYVPKPDEVCGGVWVDKRQGFVPVGLSSEFRDEEVGHTLWEYAEIDPDTGEFVPGPDSEPVIRACLLGVPVAGRSPAWHILPDAGNGKYYEVQQTVAGSGKLFHWEPATVDGGIGKTKAPIPELPGEQIDIFPDDVFQVRAARKSVGVFVLATFSGAPFKLEYEQRVSPRSLRPLT